MITGIVLPPILAKTALAETVEFLRKADARRRGDGDRSIRQEIEYAYGLKLTERATACLRTACAARILRMIVSDPANPGIRHVVPAEYFDQRPMADLEFKRGVFGAYELSELTASDPLFKLVRPFRGWVHGFVEPEFRAWLVNPETGPQAGPQVRPFFHIDREFEQRAARLRATNRGRCLRRAGTWVSIADQADWAAREGRAAGLDVDLGARAYQEFWRALRDREFDRDGKTRVPLLNPLTTWARLTPERGEWALDTHGWDIFVQAFLASCWIDVECARYWLAGWLPRDLCQRWDAVHAPAAPQQSGESPALAPGEPLAPASDAGATRAAPGSRGRKKGSGSIDDRENLRAMLRLLASGEAHSVHDAARNIAGSIVRSSQSRDADISRLRRKFARDHGTEPPAGKTWSDVAAELNGN